ncbi:RAD51-associated protein 1 [Pristis pectinata]|uniref:RAD51-associated protein 1 n=1 Tax=Pristis pectinata TaxID=685728 RepID=UPI00223D4F29|nr:RAD51-associated protein 1 [Pristis pectinata]
MVCLSHCGSWMVPTQGSRPQTAAVMPRPVRNKKIVDYSQSEDFDDDEDFACVSAPPSKKPRLKVDQKPKKGKNGKNSDSQDAKVKKELPKERLPLDEKVYQRNLKTALVLSVQEYTNEANESAEATNTDTSLHPNCNENSDFPGLDKTTAENEGLSIRPRQRQAASGAVIKQRKILLDDRGSDGECENDSGSEQIYLTSEESESNGSDADTDEEFTFKNLSNKNKKKDIIKVQTKKKEKKSPKSNSSDSALVPVKSKPLLLTEIPVSPPSSIASQASSPSTGIRKPKWIPPASKENSNASREGVFVRSPSQGLRLGLSRFAKVKPLHPCADNS